MRDSLSFSHDYARTLGEWSVNFEQRWPQIQALGFDERYQLWRFYLEYCRAGFISGCTDVMRIRTGASMRAQSALLLLPAAAWCMPCPRRCARGEADWRQWGSGEMTWLGFSLYRATLAVVGEPAAELPASSQTALRLDYQRDIPRDRLVRTGVDQEMRQTGRQRRTGAALGASCGRSSRSVKEGGKHHWRATQGGCGLRFHRGRPTGEVRDADFARLFFAALARPTQPQPQSADRAAQTTRTAERSTLPTLAPPPLASARVRRARAATGVGRPAGRHVHIAAALSPKPPARA
ncbi:MAG: class I SAM-dependent methyltransferase [Candidatus Accumulibacter sp.]|nr:class I SAM-dependent methyltransferase [Candidatus Accumulibacter propinquus]